MKENQYIKEPGFVYDLIFALSLQFNFDYYCLNLINHSKKSEDVAFYSKIKDMFGAISDDLFPFFYIRNDGRFFLSFYYFSKCNTEFLNGYSLQSVQTALTDYEQVTYRMLEFFFEDKSGEELKSAQSSLKAISDLIKNSSYNDSVKSRLYAYFVDPVTSIRMLSSELAQKGDLLIQYYETNNHMIINTGHGFNTEKVSMQMRQTMNIDLEDFHAIYYSVCLICKNMVCAYLFDKDAFIVLGYDFSDFLDCKINFKTHLEIDVIGNALAEKNRVNILDFMLEKGEVTLKDVENRLQLTGTNAYYHLSLLQKADLITSKNRGRTVYYSINKQSFRAVCDALGKYYDDQKGGTIV